MQSHWWLVLAPADAGITTRCSEQTYLRIPPPATGAGVLAALLPAGQAGGPTAMFAGMQILLVATLRTRPPAGIIGKPGQNNPNGQNNNRFP